MRWQTLAVSLNGVPRLHASLWPDDREVAKVVARRGVAAARNDLESGQESTILAAGPQG